MSSDGGGKPANSEANASQQQANQKPSGIPAPRPEIHPDPNSGKADKKSNQPNWDRIISGGTLFVLFLTFIAALYAGCEADRLANETETAIGHADFASKQALRRADDANRTSRQALISVQRAFVFMDTFEPQIVNGQLIVQPKWRNSGVTPTRYMTNWVSWGALADAPTDTFEYPDLDQSGHPASHDQASLPLTFVGPTSTRYAEILKIPEATLNLVRAGDARIFVWGWTRYKDTFGKAHVSRFCNEMKITNLPSPKGTARLFIETPLYGRYNCTDEECARQGFP